MKVANPGRWCNLEKQAGSEVVFVEGKPTGRGKSSARRGSGIIAHGEQRENSDMFRENKLSLMKTSHHMEIQKTVFHNYSTALQIAET